MKLFNLKTLIVASFGIASAAIAQAQPVHIGTYLSGASHDGDVIRITYEQSESVKETYSSLKGATRKVCRKMFRGADRKTRSQCSKALLNEAVTASRRVQLIAYHDRKTRRRTRTIRMASSI